MEMRSNVVRRYRDLEDFDSRLAAAGAVLSVAGFSAGASAGLNTRSS
jgi:hypothetical protein